MTKRHPTHRQATVQKKEDDALIEKAKEQARDIQVFDMVRAGVSLIRTADRTGLTVEEVRASLRRTYSVMRIDEVEVRDFVNLDMARLDEVLMHLFGAIRQPKQEPETVGMLSGKIVAVVKQRQSYIVGARAPLAIDANVTVTRNDIVAKLQAYLQGHDDAKKPDAVPTSPEPRPRRKTSAAAVAKAAERLANEDARPTDEGAGERRPRRRGGS